MSVFISRTAWAAVLVIGTTSCAAGGGNEEDATNLPGVDAGAAPVDAAMPDVLPDAALLPDAYWPISRNDASTATDAGVSDGASSPCVTSRPYHLALWHEGVVGTATDPTTFRTYVQQMAAFVAAKCFDKVFIELLDPTQFAWSSIDNVVYFLSLLPSNVEVGALLYVNPKDSNWGFDPSLPGGLSCNNAGYATALPDGGCGTGPTFAPGCPNDLEQGFAYLAQINAAATAQGLSQQIRAVSFDGEDIGAYGADSSGLCQALQAAAEFTPAIAASEDIGYAKGPSTNAPDGKTDAAYPELYWIGELDSCACAQECKFTPCPSSCTSCSTCYTDCRQTIYQQYLNDPAGLLAAMDTYYANYVSLWQTPGTWPMFSIEMLDGDCIQKEFGGPSCGTFDGFGNWDWDAFESYMTMFAAKYGVSQLAVYEWQFVPPAWQP